MMGLFQLLAGQRPQMQNGLLATLSNQGKLLQPQQQAPMENGAAQAMQAFQQAQATQRQPPAQSGQQSSGGLGGLASLFKLFMGG